MKKPLSPRFTVPSLFAGTAFLILAAAPITRAQPAAPAVAPASAPATAVTLPFTTPLHWKCSGVLIKPISDETHALVSVKDPTIVRFDNLWHISATTANRETGAWFT